MERLPALIASMLRLVRGGGWRDAAAGASMIEASEAEVAAAERLHEIQVEAGKAFRSRQTSNAVKQPSKRSSSGKAG